jgi:glycosyltransferase involved in cell wall biosynthesis
MRVGIDARTLSGRYTGDRTYWRGLIQGLSEIDGGHDYVLYLKQPVEGAPPRVGSNVTWRMLPKPEPDAVWIQTAFLAALRQDRVDIAHTQYNIPLLGLPCPTVTTIHDVSWMVHPEFFPQRDVAILRRFIPGSMRRACAVVAVSESTRRDILRHYRDQVEPEKIFVTPLAVDERYRPPDGGADAARKATNTLLGLSDSPYFLSVGVLQPRKNLPLLLDAFALAVLGPVDFPHRLIVVGKRGWDNDALDTTLKTLPAAVVERIVFTGYVDDGDLPALYGGATAFCYPSVYEGFGLPPLEAMTCGCPVLVSQTSSLPEVVGDAGILLPFSDSQPWARAIEKLLDPPVRARWSERALERAAGFGWRKTAALTLKAYESCLKEKPRASRS